MSISINYVWLSAELLSPPIFASEALCPTPVHYLDNVERVAELYPDHKITIWADFFGPNVCCDAVFQDVCATANLPENVRFRELSSLESYRNIPLFGMARANSYFSSGSIWLQVDLARLLVLENELENPDNDIVVYSDLDIVDPLIDTSKMDEILKKYGFAFALYDLNGFGDGIIENSLMVFSKKRRSWLSEILIPNTKENIAFDDSDGWDTLKRCLGDEFKNEGDYTRCLTVAVEVIAESEPGHVSFETRNDWTP